MIHHIVGIISSRTADSLIVEVGGVGIRLFTSQNTLEQAPHSAEQIKLYTSLVLRENDVALYGFIEEGERALFELLRTVNGVGPKVAIGILSAMTPERFKEAILSGSATSFAGVKGIGKKTAERLLLDLKDKISKLPIDGAVAPVSSQHEETALHALTRTLGFSEREARRALNEARKENGSLTTEQLIKKALAHLSHPQW